MNSTPLEPSFIHDVIIKCPTLAQVSRDLHFPSIDFQSTTVTRLKGLIQIRLRQDHGLELAIVQLRLILSGRPCVPEQSVLHPLLPYRPPPGEPVVFHLVTTPLTTPTTRTEEGNDLRRTSAPTSSLRQQPSSSPPPFPSAAAAVEHFMPSSTASSTPRALLTTTHQIHFGLPGISAPVLIIKFVFSFHLVLFAHLTCVCVTSSGMPYLLIPPLAAAQTPLHSVQAHILPHHQQPQQQQPLAAAAANPPFFFPPLHPPPAAGAAAARPLMQREDIMQALDLIWTLCKYLFFVYLFTLNASTERWLLMHALALLAFLAQTGHLRRFLPQLRFPSWRLQARTPPAVAGQARGQRWLVRDLVVNLLVPFVGTLIPGVEQYFLQQQPEAQEEQLEPVEVEAEEVEVNRVVVVEEEEAAAAADVKRSTRTDIEPSTSHSTSVQNPSSMERLTRRSPPQTNSHDSS